MKSNEIKFERNLSYNELVAYLLAKYGVAKYPYFCNKECKSKQKNNSRTNEGLFLHHIGENMHIQLSQPSYAKRLPFEKYQGALRLVYCNYIEHLLLHIKITEEYLDNDEFPVELVGIGGVVNFIAPELVTYYHNPPKDGWRKNVFDVVNDNLDDFIEIIHDFKDNKSLNKYYPNHNFANVDGLIILDIYELFLKKDNKNEDEISELLLKAKKNNECYSQI